MSILHREDPAPAAAVARASGEVAALDGRLWAAVADDALVEVVEEVAGLRARLAAIEAEVLVELDVREVPRRRLHWGSTGDWYAHCAGTSRATARRTLRHAHDLVGDRRETFRALRCGQVSPAQAGVVCDAVSDLPGAPLLRRRAEQVLLEEAGRLDATDLARAGRRVLDTVDPDREERRAEADLEREERAAHAQRFFSLADDGCGGVRLRGRGSLEDAAVIRAALLPLTRPEPAVDIETGAPVERDPRDHGARMWDALLAVSQHALDTDLPPASHGARPRVSVLIPIADLLAGTGLRTATTDDGLDLHPAVVRRLACDAEVVPVVLGADGSVLDVGRSRRTATEPIWRALVARDRHCAFPGCRRPPLMCHAHHVVHWADGGDTALDNLVVLCGEHHRVIHHTPRRVRISARDHRPELLPPRRHYSDPDPAWIRHRERRDPQRE